jgi:hypothetical protein
VADDWDIVLNIWIAIEKLVSPANDENADKQKDDRGEREDDAQCWDAGLFNHRCHNRIARLHTKPVPVLSIGCYDASVGFSAATQERIATPSLEVRGSGSTAWPQPNSLRKIKEGRVKPEVTIEYCTD